MKNLKFVLVFALSLLGHFLWGQCPSVETRINGAFEERLLLFKDGRCIKSKDGDVKEQRGMIS